MKTVLLFFAALVMVFLASFGASYAWYSQERLEALAAENKELRLRDANRAWRKDLRNGKQLVPDEAIAEAAYDMGTKASLLGAAAIQERGGPIYEMGHGGKTAFIWLSVPPDRTQEYEAARTLNKALWDWAWADPKRRKDAIKALAKAYTHPAQAKRWAQNVTKLEVVK